jgi:imidazoleglycerol-phosphate dehydratase
MNRTATRTRTTAETSVTVTVDLDGTGRYDVSTGVPFYNHLLGAFSKHSLVDVDIDATGDLDVDDHHTVEDVALVLGEALSAALGDRAGIQRFGDAAVPMDEALARCAIDVSGRPYAVVDVALQNERIGTFTTQNFPHLVESLARTAGLSLHLSASGHNDHHVAEAAMKALARALRAAIAVDTRRAGDVPSTKGTL